MAEGKRIRNDYEEEEEGRPRKIPRTLVEKTKDKRLIVVLENASLETVKVRVEKALQNCLELLSIIRLEENLNF